MRATNRFWTVAALAGALVVWATVLGRPLPLVGAAGIVAWLLAQQYRFVRLVEDSLGSLTVDHSVSRQRVPADGTTLLTTSVDADEPLPLSTHVQPSVPAGADSHSDTFTIERGDRTNSHSFDITWPVAGAFTIDPPTLTFRDALGLFERTVQTGPERAVQVQPRARRNVHVGEGGDLVAVGVGEHETGDTGSGLEPADIREYVPGDSINDVDWNATARLGELHVREFETETDRETMLFVDHRATLGAGTPGETKLDYLRQVALAFVDSARDLSDPLGCYTVGDAGLTGTYRPSANADRQLDIRRHLQAVSPTETTDRTHDRQPSSPARAQAVQQRLATDDTDFGRRLVGYFDRPEAYVERVAEDPLVAAVRSARAGHEGANWSVILTDDERETEVREAVKLARRIGTGDGGVLVFLAPTSLYEPGSLADLDAAYDRYADFERFRRSLAAIDGVSAYEVGPADRLDAVLASGRRQWSGGGR